MVWNGEVFIDLITFFLFQKIKKKRRSRRNVCFTHCGPEVKTSFVDLINAYRPITNTIETKSFTIKRTHTRIDLVMTIFFCRLCIDEQSS